MLSDEKKIRQSIHNFQNIMSMVVDIKKQQYVCIYIYLLTHLHIHIQKYILHTPTHVC